MTATYDVHAYMVFMTAKVTKAEAELARQDPTSLSSFLWPTPIPTSRYEVSATAKKFIDRMPTRKAGIWFMEKSAAIRLDFTEPIESPYSDALIRDACPPDTGWWIGYDGRTYGGGEIRLDGGYAMLIDYWTETPLEQSKSLQDTRGHMWMAFSEKGSTLKYNDKSLRAQAPQKLRAYVQSILDEDKMF